MSVLLSMVMIMMITIMIMVMMNDTNKYTSPTIMITTAKATHLISSPSFSKDHTKPTQCGNLWPVFTSD